MRRKEAIATSNSKRPVGKVQNGPTAFESKGRVVVNYQVTIS